MAIVSHPGGIAHPGLVTGPAVLLFCTDGEDMAARAGSALLPSASPLLRPSATSSPISSTCGSEAVPGSSHPQACGRRSLVCAANVEKMSRTCQDGTRAS